MPALFIKFYPVCRRKTWESHLEEQRRLYHQLVEEIIIANPEVQLFLVLLWKPSKTIKRIFSAKGGGYPPIPLGFFGQKDFLLKGGGKGIFS